jgi:AraC family transcriptional regulator
MTALAEMRDIGIERTLLAQGRGWQVSDVTFRAHSTRSRFASRHESVMIAAVTAGSFRYRSRHGSVTLMPGALMLGNAGSDFECSYDEAWGDRCISFGYSDAYFERIAAGTGRGKRAGFRTHRAAPTPRMIALTAELEAQSGHADVARWEELAVRVAGDALCVADETPTAVSSRDERRIGTALGLIETHYSEPLSLGAIADAVHMSPYHFLRVFRAVAGVTPHQYLVRTRLRRAAIALATSDEPVTDIAYAHGFGDLSSFVTTFRRVFGRAPRDYRVAARARQVALPARAQ